MLAVKGTYQNGRLILNEKIPFTEPVAVIVTFLEEKVVSKKLDITQFSFAQSREILKDVKGSLSDVLIEERRSAL